MELKVGTLLKNGTYRIMKKLGQGSFGITYIAEHTAQGKKVAIKEFFMKDINSRSDDGSITGMTDGNISYYYGQKFKREAINLDKLEHPNIVRVTDYFEENNTYYYVMDFIEGDNLNDYLNSHTVSENEAITIIKDVASALTYMHDQHHMLHLDLKPGNIMRRASDGHIFLIDFGLSKHYNSDGQPETSTTIGLGTPGYAPIEQGNQARGGEFRPTIDVYSLGATLFKLLTGETPPVPSDLLANPGILAQKMNEKGIMQPVATVVMKAMKPVAQNRFPTVRDFRNQLANLDTVPQQPPQVSQQVPYQNEETGIASDYQAPQQVPYQNEETRIASGYQVPQQVAKVDELFPGEMLHNNKPAMQQTQSQQSYVEPRQDQYHQDDDKPKCPNNFLVWAIISTVLCFPFGIPAIINATKVKPAYEQGYYDEAVDRSRRAKKWALIGTIVGAVCEVIFYIIYIALMAVNSNSYY